MYKRQGVLRDEIHYGASDLREGAEVLSLDVFIPDVVDPIEGMPKKRRKLNKDMEAEMAAAKRKIELVGALINDIRNEDIQAEYLGAFTQIRSAVVNLIAKYTTDGFCEETEGLLALYKGLIQQFEEEYEL